MSSSPNIPNITNFFGSAMPPNAPVLVGMNSTADFNAFGVQGYKPTFASQAMQRWRQEGVILYPILAARATTIKSLAVGFNIKTSTFPTLETRTITRAVNARAHSTLHVESTEGIIPNMLFLVGLFGEMIRVTAIEGPNSLVVLRGVGSHILPRDIPAKVKLIYAGSVVEEGSFRPLPMTTAQTSWQVHSHIVRNAWSVTKTYGVLPNIFTDKPIQSSREECLRHHALDLESVILFSQSGATVLHNQPMRTSAGLLDFQRLGAPQNFITVAVPVSVDDLEVLFDQTTNVRLTGYNNPNRVGWADSMAITTITNAKRLMQGIVVTLNSNTDVTTSDSLVTRQRVTTIKTPRTTVELQEHPLLTLAMGGGTTDAGMVIVLDVSQLEIAFLEGRQTVETFYNYDPKTNGYTIAEMDNGVDAAGGSVLTEFVFINKNPAASAILIGLTRAAPPETQACLPVTTCK